MANLLCKASQKPMLPLGELGNDRLIISGDHYMYTDLPASVIRHRIPDVSGGQGCIKCYEKLSTGELVVVKQYTGLNKQRHFKNMKELMNGYIHEDFVCVPLDMDEDKNVMVFELSIGDLFDLISSEKIKRTRDLLLNIMVQTTNCVRQLHLKGVVHADIKPENVLIFNREFGIQIKLCDMDSAHVMSKEVQNTRPYTEFYTAHDDEVTEKSDAYSLAMTLFVLFTRSTTLDFTNLFKELSLHFSEASTLVRNLI